MSAALTLAVALAAAQVGAQTKVLVLPLDARQVNPFHAKEIDEGILASAKAIATVSVIDSQLVARDTGVELSKHAQSCKREVVCLSQLGAMLGADKILTGELKEGVESTDILWLHLLDVKKAKMVDTLSWRVPIRDNARKDAANAAARQLLDNPDATVLVQLTPKNSRIFVYGEELGEPPHPETIPYWSGTYIVRIEAPGHIAKNVRFFVRKGRVSRLRVFLEPDPLHVPKEPSRAVQKDRPSTVTAEVEPEGGGGFPPALSNPVSLAMVGLGLTGVVVGTLFMTGAQSDYNALSEEQRYAPGITLPTDGAMTVRDDAQGQFSLGSIVAASGALLLAGGAAWMIFDAASASDDHGSDVEELGKVSCAPGVLGGILCSASF